MPDLTFMVHHLISGFLSVTAALVLYYIILYMIGKKLPVAHIAISLIFCLYLTGILAATGICIRASFSPNFTFIPFVDMIRGPIGTALNILLFVPMGFFIPMLYKNYDTISKTALAGFLISLSVECLQMFGFGATDINDLITNTIGVCIGYGLFKLLYRATLNPIKKHIQIYGSFCYFELPFFWVCTVVIMLTIQIRLFHTIF